MSVTVTEPQTDLEVARIHESIKAALGCPEVPLLFASMSDAPAYLFTAWTKYMTVLDSGALARRDKEFAGLAVAMAKGSDYMVGYQRERLEQQGITSGQLTEALATADFFEGFNAFVHALHVDSDMRPRRLMAGDMSLIDQEIDVNVSYILTSEDPTVRRVFDEIKTKFGIPFVPNIFKALAHTPTALDAKWASFKAIMLQGELGRRTKELIAVAVSAVNSCSYCVDAHSGVLLQLGLAEAGLVEAAAAIDLFAGLCSYAIGRRL